MLTKRIKFYQMRKKYLGLLFTLFFTAFTSAQIVINEFDTDTDGIDNLEFIELKTPKAFQSLEGYVVVLFNGSSSGGDKSYLAYDLDGYTTDINGILTIGSNYVSPVPVAFLYPNTMQNGADAVAVYHADASHFPERTLATKTNLIDALVYETDDSKDEVLLGLLGLTQQINEDENNNREVESIQRNADGTYFVGKPTPGKLNDGSGVERIGLALTFSKNEFTEGDTLNLTFTTEKPVEETLEVDFALMNGTFTKKDFSGNTSVHFSVGESSVKVDIVLLDDTIDEGDEVLLVQLADLPSNYVKLDDRVALRVVDNDFSVAAYGTPLAPTYGKVESTQPEKYYASLNGKSAMALREALQDIIANPAVVRAQTYSDIVDILKEADENPANSNEVWVLYREKGMAKLDFQTSSDNTGTWNREHVYPRSRGGFYSIKQDRVSDGSTVYWKTNEDSIRHGNSDAHALRASNSIENSTRGNRDYGEYVGPDGNQGSFKGDVARSIFYMVVRYNGLEVVPGNPPNSTEGKLGDLNLLLQWHRNDPPDDFEMHRNNVIYTWQKNRNPFIDQPELVSYIFGAKKGEVWEQSLAIDQSQQLAYEILPNPTSGEVKIIGSNDQVLHVEVFTITGKKVFFGNVLTNTVFDLRLLPGLYFVKLTTQKGEVTTEKLVVK